jgi:hypothetical protein
MIGAASQALSLGTPSIESDPFTRAARATAAVRAWSVASVSEDSCGGGTAAAGACPRREAGTKRARRIVASLRG